jgi:hypothetical protein
MRILYSRKQTPFRRIFFILLGLCVIYVGNAGFLVDEVFFTINADDSKLTVMLTDIDSLAGGFHYEGWAIVNEAPVTTGKFNIDQSGNLVDPDGDSDDIPAATKILGGEVVENSAQLSTAFGGALGDDFSEAAGSYILATPTNGPDTDENSGIWFLKPQLNSVALEFDGLTQLMDGFHYEGWVIIDGTPLQPENLMSTLVGIWSISRVKRLSKINSTPKWILVKLLILC